MLHAQADLRARIGDGEVPREIRDAPFVQVPLGVTEDRLVGTVDIEASMKVGPQGMCSLVWMPHCGRWLAHTSLAVNMASDHKDLCTGLFCAGLALSGMGLPLSATQWAR